MEIKKFILYYFTCLSLTFAKNYVSTLKKVLEFPKDFKSIAYDLYIQTSEADYHSNDTNLGFTGSVKITIKFEESITEPFQINLDVVETTEIFQIQVYDEAGEEITDHISHRMNNSYLTLNSHESLHIGSTLDVKIRFRNLYGSDMYGFYRSYYIDQNKTRRWLLTTQFEATYARKVFPCFDNPSWKAIFNLKIEIPESMEDYDVFCNTPVTDRKSENKKKIFTCQKTALPMPTYILAFTVSDFKCTEKEEFKSNYPKQTSRFILTCGRKEFIKNKEGELSQKTAKQIVTALGDYLGCSYAFEKIHQVGIPDFAAGAMENWGHISYRETRLFFNEEKDSSMTKQSIVLVIAHELVHQWFGNLVTLEYWDYIWLNEAFATYLSYKIADEIEEPKKDKWQYNTQFLVDEMHLKAFEADGFPSSTPLSHKIPNENFVMSYFSSIPYAKGASVLRMWEHFLGKDNFQKSLQQYISKNAKQTGNPSDLYAAFHEKGSMMDDFFKCWHEQPGYPVVEVKKLSKTNYSLSQHRFLWEKPEKNFTTIWTFPISYFTSSSKDVKQIQMSKNETELNNIDSDWFILNDIQAGYYRVNYEKEHWEALGDALKKKNFSDINEFNRAQLINDVFSLARSVYKDYVDYGTALTLTEFLKNDSSLIVWKTALKSFEFVQLKLGSDAELSDKFRSYVLELLKPHFKSLENNAGTHTEKLFSFHINQWACSLDLENCTKEAEKIYKENKSLPDMEETILCTVIRNNNELWNEIFKKYQAESKSATKLRYLSALGCTNDTATAESFLKKTLDTSSGIREQDCLHVFSSVCKNKKNIQTAFKFIENNYKIMNERYGGINALGGALGTLAEKLHEKEDLERMKNLGEKLNGIVPKESIEKAIQTLSSNVKWKGEKIGEIEDYLNSGFLVTISLSLISLCSFIIYVM